MRFKAGDWVVVKSREQILATLDPAGEIGKMPFMPEMLKFCGTRLRVSAVAHKTCDVACKTGGRRLDDSVHLENIRCDGSGHGGCEAGCLLFWKTQWLEPADTGSPHACIRPSLACEQILCHAGMLCAALPQWHCPRVCSVAPAKNPMPSSSEDFQLPAI